MSQHEGSPTVAPEQRVVDVHLFLQENLGITEDVARDLADIQVECPVPGVNAQLSLGEFILTPHGSEKIETVMTQAKKAMELGADVETALGFGLGAMAVKTDEAGKLIRVSRESEQVKKK
jgi:hypothetical protein